MNPVEAFADQVGPVDSGPVTCIGGRTQWAVGGEILPSTREVSAPAGVVGHEPGEMIVRVRAGTTLAELASATEVGGQFVALEADDPERATVGGVLACGRSGVRRLGRGPIRDSVLEVTAVASGGQVIRAGAPLVKNVTGFDLCRLLVGSVGTLAFLAEVVLRCQPQPEVESWWATPADAGVDPVDLHARLYRPLSVLWDGSRVWVGLAGYRADVDSQARAVLEPGGRFERVAGPPPMPGPVRRSLPVADLAGLPRMAGPGGWLAEIGVGVVHCGESVAFSVPGRIPTPGVVELHRRIKDRFDPSGRLNPGRSPLAPEPVGSR